MSDFAFLTDEDVKNGYTEGDNDTFEIAYQLKRIADILDNKLR